MRKMTFFVILVLACVCAGSVFAAEQHKLKPCRIGHNPVSKDQQWNPTTEFIVTVDYPTQVDMTDANHKSSRCDLMPGNHVVASLSDGRWLRVLECSNPIVGVPPISPVPQKPKEPTPAPPALLIVHKIVINHDSHWWVNDFTFMVDDTIKIPVDTAIELPPGIHSLGEVSLPAQFHVTYSGDCDSQGKVVLVAGKTSTCTITNEAIVQPPPAPPTTTPPPPAPKSEIQYFIGPTLHRITYGDRYEKPWIVNGIGIEGGVRFNQRHAFYLELFGHRSPKAILETADDRACWERYGKWPCLTAHYEHRASDETLGWGTSLGYRYRIGNVVSVGPYIRHVDFGSDFEKTPTVNAYGLGLMLETRFSGSFVLEAGRIKRPALPAQTQTTRVYWADYGNSYKDFQHTWPAQPTESTLGLKIAWDFWF